VATPPGHSRGRGTKPYLPHPTEPCQESNHKVVTPATNKLRGIEFVDLAFSDPVTNATVTVSYNDEPLPGVTTVTSGEIIRFELAGPLELAGR